MDLMTKIREWPVIGVELVSTFSIMMHSKKTCLLILR